MYSLRQNNNIKSSGFFFFFRISMLERLFKAIAIFVLFQSNDVYIIYRTLCYRMPNRDSREETSGFHFQLRSCCYLVCFATQSSGFTWPAKILFQVGFGLNSLDGQTKAVPRSLLLTQPLCSFITSLGSEGPRDK